ncbi:MAG: O-antigen ligase family protein [Lachnospiraceae bacterium]|nr:O-antigen ligase family protein [Lachnospiraceae bacterium]
MKKAKRTKVPIRDMLPVCILFLFYSLAELPLMAGNRYAGFDFAPDNALQYDEFLVVKVFFLLFISVWILITLLLRFRHSLTFKEFMPGIVLFLFLILSFVFSVNKTVSLRGANELFEPFPVIVSYIIVFYGTGLIVKYSPGDRDSKLLLIMRCICINVFITCVWGMTQALRGVPVAVSLYNPDYVGSYGAVFLPVFIIMIMGFFEKNPTVRWRLLLFLSILLVILLFLSGSAAGMAGSATGLISGICLFFFGKDKRKIAIMTGILVSVALILVLILYETSYSPSGFGDLSLRTGGRYAEFSAGNEKILIREDFDEYGYEEFTILNEDGEKIPYEGDPERNTLVAMLPEDSAFKDFHFNPMELKSGERGFLVHLADRDFYFGQDEKGSCHSMNAYGKLVDLAPAETAGLFTEREGFLHGRGYIWDRSLPLLKKCWLFGCGPDAFPFIFPQNDIEKILRSGLPYEELVLKPHSFYLQTALQLGLPFLFVLLFMAGQLFITSLRILAKRDPERDKGERIIAAALSASLISFMAAGLINDSSLCVTPLALALFSTGFYSLKGE